jgi:hypothetical protein
MEVITAPFQALPFDKPRGSQKQTTISGFLQPKVHSSIAIDSPLLPLQRFSEISVEAGRQGEDGPGMEGEGDSDSVQGHSWYVSQGAPSGPSQSDSGAWALPLRSLSPSSESLNMPES